ncbi:MAG: glycosyltransferase family 9 protein, partial [Pseudomonadota bacterium]
SGLDWVVEQSRPSKIFRSFSKAFSWLNLVTIWKYLRAEKFDQAVVLHAPWFVGFALWLARVPVRSGRLSQWHSFLFFNRGLRQKRSLSQKHESEYNFDLITKATNVDWSQRDFAPPKMIAPSEVETPIQESKDYFVVHPGMMGSALNWPIEHYIELVQSICEKSVVVVTGTKADRAWTSPLQAALKAESNVLWYQERMSPKQLLVTLANAKLVVAPSTGVIHLAAALGRPVVGFYSPRRAESQVRWGPLTDKKHIFVPEDADMASIQVHDVLVSAFEGLI